MVTASSVRGAVARVTVKGGKKKKKMVYWCVCVCVCVMTYHSRLLAFLSFFCYAGLSFSPSRPAHSPGQDKVWACGRMLLGVGVKSQVST